MRSSRRQAVNPVWNQLEQFQDEWNRLFDRWGTSFVAPSTFPALNVWEDGEEVFVEAKLPGLDLKDLEIYVTRGNQLVIKGEGKPPLSAKGVWHRQERIFGAFNRDLTLSFPIDADKVDARVENGVLRLKLTKHRSVRLHNIPVKAE